MTTRPSVFLPAPADAREMAALAFAPMAWNLEDSKIRHVAQEVWDLQARGEKVLNLTIGDFNARQFPVPESFLAFMAEEARAGQTNYTPSDGLPEVRKAIAETYARELGVDYGPDAVLVGAGARPVMYSLFQSFLQPGDGFAYGVPSWNTQYYVYMNSARGLPIRTTAASRFLPTADQVRQIIGEARILCLNSPLNPTGTAYQADELDAVCRVVLEENLRRRAAGQRPCILIFDQVYWRLTGEGQHHVHPLALVPELAPWTVYIDGISKAMAATGLRVGWAFMPPYLKNPLKALMGHIGGFAPRPEQRATARYLADVATLGADLEKMNAGIRARLRILVEAARKMEAEGLPVEHIPPQGGIYLSIRFDLHGRTTPDGTVLDSNEAIRRHLLHKAGLAVVPFQAFDLEDETGWFRMSVGTVSLDEIQGAMARVADEIRSLR